MDPGTLGSPAELAGRAAGEAWDRLNAEKSSARTIQVLEEDMALWGLAARHVARLLELVGPVFFDAAKDDFTGERCRMNLSLLLRGRSLEETAEPIPEKQEWNTRLRALSDVMEDSFDSFAAGVLGNEHVGGSPLEHVGGNSQLRKTVPCVLSSWQRIVHFP